MSANEAKNYLKTDAENMKRQTLRRMKMIATSCVVGALGIRVGAAFLDDAVWVGYLRAMSEAAVVGGLADWFAVTALFRHPLGWKIPHTRIIPENKDRISRSIASFVSTHFLSKDVLQEQCAKLQPCMAIARLVNDNVHGVASSIVAFVPRFLDLLDHEKVDEMLRKNIAEKLGTVELAPLAGKVIDFFTQGSRSQVLINELLDALSDGLTANQDVIIEMVRRELPLPDQFAGLPLLATMKNALADKIGHAAMQRLLATVEEVRGDEYHVMRGRLLDRIAAMAERLREDAELQQKMAKWRDEWIAHPQTERQLGDFLTTVKLELKREVIASQAALHQVIVEILQSASQRFMADPVLCERGDEMLRPMIIKVVADSAPALENIIRETVQRWDGEELADKIELEVGRDLQFVRLNGTLVGALLGVLLHGLLSLVP